MKTYDAAISLYLSSKGLNKSNKGYCFLVEAIRTALGSRDTFSKVTELYAAVAQKYVTQPQNVERAIRYTISALGVTNKEFISRAAEDIAAGSAVTGAQRKMVCRRP